MEFDFICDRDGLCSLELNGGEQTALERWFNAEERQSVAALDEILKVIAALKEGKKREFVSNDAEFQITLTPDDCFIVANWLLFDAEFEAKFGRQSVDELEEESLSADENDARAECGLDDFAYLLEEWRAFLLENQS